MILKTWRCNQCGTQKDAPGWKDPTDFQLQTVLSGRKIPADWHFISAGGFSYDFCSLECAHLWLGARIAADEKPPLPTDDPPPIVFHWYPARWHHNLEPGLADRAFCGHIKSDRRNREDLRGVAKQACLVCERATGKSPTHPSGGGEP